MKKITILLLFFCFLMPCLIQAQATLEGKITNATNVREVKVRYSKRGFFKKDSEMTVPMNGDSFAVTLPIEENGIAYFAVKGATGNGASFALYLEKKATLKLTFDATDIDKTLAQEGDLKRENEHLRALYGEFNKYLAKAEQTLRQDTVAASCYQKAMEASRQRLNFLEAEAKQSKWSKAYKVFAQKEVEGAYADLFGGIASWHFGASMMKRNNTFKGQGWDKALVEKILPLVKSTDKALWKGYYMNNLRNTEKLITVLGVSAPQEITREMVAEGVLWTKAGKKITETFSGEFLEEQYANFILAVASQKNYEKTLLGLIDDFKQRFPQSIYTTELEERRKEVAMFQEAKSKSLLEEIKIVENYKDINSFAELLAPFKGKVVFVDLWGTWCAHCKEQMKYMPALKEYFKGKDVVYLYAANETGNHNKEERWLNMIKAQNLTGYHLIGNERLWKDIWAQLATVTDEEIAQQTDEHLKTNMRDVKDGKGGYKVFPTYLIINEKGEMAVKFAQEPSTKELLYKQIEKILAK